ncbi:hypothetical protein BCR37DRAFT_103986 [Protomyces lactucae-debilis]|uniref:Uncharacterized protein n=1 Tax=Protomyces lactucae-debilis TaxID=2754530 RepID=A0A1Y2F5E8_PROLT|nr:uncharacterized protein BCR37DRAFT_103986 [Protomyces lactucae-debilis]ORY79083.1 hypothetical protein BCR37DRAFT_103986 [Protomyces lactucae-debilis]
MDVCEHPGHPCNRPRTLYTCSCNINVDWLKVYHKPRCNLANMHNRILSLLQAVVGRNAAMIVQKDIRSPPQVLRQFTCAEKIGQCHSCTPSIKKDWQPCFLDPPNQACVEQEALESLLCYPFPWMSTNERMALSDVAMYRHLVLAFGKEVIDDSYEHNKYVVPLEDS